MYEGRLYKAARPLPVCSTVSQNSFNSNGLYVQYRAQTLLFVALKAGIYLPCISQFISATGWLIAAAGQPISVLFRLVFYFLLFVLFPFS